MSPMAALPRMRARPVWLLLIALALLAGCGGRQADTAPPVLAAPASMPTRTPTPTPAVSSDELSTEPSAEPSTAPDMIPTAPVTAPVDAAAPVSVAGMAASPMPTPTPDATLPLSRTINILVLGSDRRPNMPNWRTDVIMIIALDLANGQAAAISLPRDLYLDEIPGHQPNKINVVDYLGERDEPGGGGPRLLANILMDKLGIPIHHYLRFEFQGFKQVIDALGGLEIDIDCPAYEYLPEEDILLNLKPGHHTLTGAQALAYVRARNQGGDLERARRQQRVVWAVRNQILSQNLLPRIPALYAALKDSVQTDIGLLAAIRYARFALSLNEEDIHGMVIQRPLIKDGWRRGMFVFLTDWDALSAHMQTVFDRPPLFQTNTVGEGGDRPRCP